MAVSKDKLGVWRVSFYYTDWRGQRLRMRKSGFKTQRDAKEWEREKLELIESGCNMSVATMVPKFLAYKEERLKSSTFKSYQSFFTKIVIPLLGDRTVNEIIPRDIYEWQQVEKAKGSSIASIQHKHRLLASFFKYMVTFYGLKENPAVRCGTPINKEPIKQEIKFWTLDQYQQFMDYFHQQDKTWYRRNRKIIFVIKMLYWTGLRIGELLALTSEDIVDDSIIVSKSMNASHEVTLPKTKKSNRRVTLPKNLMVELLEYRDKIPYLKKNDPLFPFSRNLITTVLKRVSAEANVPIIRIHDLRHSHASLLVEKGCSILLIQKRLGHVNVETTLNVYSHLYPERDIELANQLDELI